MEIVGAECLFKASCGWWWWMLVVDAKESGRKAKGVGGNGGDDEDDEQVPTPRSKPGEQPLLLCHRPCRQHALRQGGEWRRREGGREGRRTAKPVLVSSLFPKVSPSLFSLHVLN